MNSEKVLVVDDDESVLRLVRAKLERAGIAADTAASAEEALTVMGTKLYHTVIADINMPGMSGVEMVEALKQRSPLVQVIMLTGEATFGKVLDCIDRGAVDFFSKTDDLTELVASVSASLNRVERWTHLIGLRHRQPAGAGA